MWAKLSVVLLIVALAGLIFLDAKVRYNLNERQWQLPARVYARPLQLQPGDFLTVEDLIYELNLLGYDNHHSWREPGQYQRSAMAVQIHTRGFQLPSGQLQPQRVVVEFAGERISQLQTAGGLPLQHISLEPIEIGSIYSRHREDRLLVRLEQVPQSLVDILLLIEDRSFYDHFGLSPRSIGRALLANIRAGRTVQGGSTITQQLVKNVFLTKSRSIWRKALEAVMALQVEWHYSKREIIEAYLNEVYLGQEGPRAIHGFALASRHYFNRPLEALDAGQIALLVGMVKGPSYYDPWRYPQRAIARRNVVLEVMAQHQLITPDQLHQFVVSPMNLAKDNALAGVYPAYLDLVRRQLRRDYSETVLQTQGMKIFTAFDPIVQRHAEQSLSTEIGQWDTGIEGAMVVTAVGSGDVVAVVGGRRMRFAGFNRAIDAVRPVGSLIKPAVYLAALEQSSSYTLATPLSDGPVEVLGQDGSVWQPQNFDRQHHGNVLLHTALAQSYNRATARLGMQVGLAQVIMMVERLGITRPVPPLPAMLLGAVELSPMEVAMMYQTIAANGVRAPLRSIVSVADHEGKPVARYPVQLSTVIDEQLMHLLHYAMIEVMQEGTGSNAYQSLPQNYKVAGKTGTTNDLRDSWFAGFAGDYLAVVWLGRDDNSSAGLTGAGGALKVWRQFMAQASHQPIAFAKPQGVVYRWVDSASGKLSRSVCEGARLMPFLQGSAPVERAPCDTSLPGIINWFKNLFE